MKLIIAGIGPGPDLISLEALNALASSNVVFVPRSKPEIQGIAEGIIARWLDGKKIVPVYFPMVCDEIQRQKIIHEQLTSSKSKWENSEIIFFPVIGDSVLFSTGKYLLDEFRKIIPNLDVSLIPGISAHSMAAACAKKFLAMKNEILSIIPGTAEPEKIAQALKSSDTIAIYKPKAIKNIHDIINPDEYSKILRVDFAGFPERENIINGKNALENINEYFSIILLWKNY